MVKQIMQQQTSKQMCGICQKEEAVVIARVIGSYKDVYGGEEVPACEGCKAQADDLIWEARMDANDMEMEMHGYDDYLEDMD